MTIAAVIVTHESDTALPALLASLREHEPDVDVAVVDSGSPSGPPDLPDDTQLVRLADNVGFGTACNRGVEALVAAGHRPDVVVCCNPDVRLRGPSLTELAAAMDERPATGVAVPPVVAPDGAPVAAAWGPTSALRGFLYGAGWRLPRLRRLAARLSGPGGINTSGATLLDDDVLVDGHVLGGAMAVRMDCWDQLGGFDEDFFLYWEDADLCHRARAAGYEVRVVPVTPVVHDAGTSSAGVLLDQRWDWYVEGAERFAGRHLTPGAGRRLVTALRTGRRFSRRG